MNAPDGPIAQINIARGFRGGERQTEMLVRGLADRGYQQRLVARRGETLIENLSREPVPGLEICPVGGLTAAAMAVRGCLLTHVHDGRASHAANLAELLFKVPYIVTRRIAVSPKRGPFTGLTYRRAARIVGVCKAAADVMQSWTVPSRINVVFSACSGLSSNPDQIAELKRRFKGCFLIGCVGALDQQQKGQAFLIEVAANLKNICPDMHFLFLGSGPDKQKFQKMAAGLSNVTFEGFRNNVGDYLAVFDLFAMPSLMEGIGGILIDAMDFGVPAVASAVDGLPEVIEDGKTGLLVPASDVEALQTAILRLYREPDLRHSMSDAARKRSDVFALSAMVDGYQRIYSEVLAEAFRGRGI